MIIHIFAVVKSSTQQCGVSRKCAMLILLIPISNVFPLSNV